MNSSSAVASKAGASSKARREALRKKQVELKIRLEAIRNDFGRGLDKDSSERAVELENAEVLNEIARVTEQELENVVEELRRLDRGE